LKGKEINFKTSREMIVMKFGGSSLADADGVKQVAEIVKKYLAKNPVVVVSAHNNTTDELVCAVENASKGILDIEGIKAAHYKIANDLGVEIPGDIIEEFEALFKGISVVKGVTPRVLDYAMSFGERFSSRIVAAYFNKIGIASESKDSFDIGMITDSKFGSASPTSEAEKLLRSHILKSEAVLVITGFIGKDENGNITTFGRNGSDYTASIIGAALVAEEIQIWTDVDGVLSADPSIVKDVKPVLYLSFEEAKEIGYYNAKILRPAFLLPAIKKGIPIRVLNTFKPNFAGTTILARIPPSEKQKIKSIVYKDKLVAVYVRWDTAAEGSFVPKILEVFNKNGIIVDMISSSIGSGLFVVENGKAENFQVLVKDIFPDLKAVIKSEMAIISVVGEGVTERVEVADSIHQLFSEANLKIFASCVTSNTGFVLVVEGKDLKKAVNMLQKNFCE